ncbi:MAG: FemAB family PEP-CTERM system-associated protein [Acidobacteriota bacterium]|nr:FemAB family PEP-CTERM system-associated protein [Acidobacteriota bacterium]
MTVDLCGNGSGWDAFAAAAAGAGNYHRWIWKEAIEATFGHRGYYLAASEGGAIRGVLPLFLIRSRLFGSSLVSVPFFSYGGILAASDDARGALGDAAIELAREVGARHVELRGGEAGASGWTGTAEKVVMEVDLTAGADALWQRLSSRLRNKVRHAENRGFRVQWGGAADVAAFYPVFAGNMRNLGTPVYPRAWFENLCRVDPEGTRIVTVWDGGRAIAGAFLCEFGRNMEAPWIASLPEGRKDYSSVLLYWSFLQYAASHGCGRFDLGRCTPNGGTYSFKKLWGCMETPLHWYYWLAPGRDVPRLRPENTKFHMAIQVWKHLPLFVANLLGPRIVRSLP